MHESSWSYLDLQNRILILSIETISYSILRTAGGAKQAFRYDRLFQQLDGGLHIAKASHISSYNLWFSKRKYVRKEKQPPKKV